MELKIRYENEYQTITLTQEDTDSLWISLSLDGDGLSREEKEHRIQEAWEERFNRPDYNCWHKLARHTDPAPKARLLNGKTGHVKMDEDSNFEMMDHLAVSDFNTEEAAREDEALLRERIRSVLKPDYAEMIIAIHLDGMKPGEYAVSIGEKPNTLNHRLQRAEKKLREIFQKTSF